MAGSGAMCSRAGRSCRGRLDIDDRAIIQYRTCMRTITIKVEEEVYEAFQEEAKKTTHSASELIRRAMEEYKEAHIAGGTSIFDHEPVSVGRVTHPLDEEDDLLGEMLS